MSVRISSHLHRPTSLLALGALAASGLTLGVSALPTALAAPSQSTASGIHLSGTTSQEWQPTVTGTASLSERVSSRGPDKVVSATAALQVKPGYARATITGLTVGGMALPSVSITCVNGVTGAPQITGSAPSGVSVAPGGAGIGARITLPGLQISVGKVACGTSGGQPTSTPRPSTPNPTSPPPTSSTTPSTTTPKPTATLPPRVPAAKATAEPNHELTVTG
ncbi:hypothetical protein GCM10022247_35060 [Allokutzneria multivorans]|uniref:Uncharacterized protein n=1 Tax=Allokutzneria multivorans TaxID=1142134 RepID=A0ABP7SD29_9PSEU